MDMTVVKSSFDGDPTVVLERMADSDWQTSPQDSRNSMREMSSWQRCPMQLAYAEFTEFSIQEINEFRKPFQKQVDSVIEFRMFFMIWSIIAPTCSFTHLATL